MISIDYSNLTKKHPINMTLIYESDSELLSEYYQHLQEQKAKGKKLIGYFAHEFVPDELIISLDAIPVPLILAGDEERNIIGSDYLTPTMCPFALSQLGSFDKIEESIKYRFFGLIDGIIATNYCAADFLVNEWISENYNNKIFHYHIPFLQSRAHIRYYSSEIEKFSNELSELTGKTFSIKDYITANNEYKKTYELLDALSEIKMLGSERNRIHQMVRLFGPTPEIQQGLVEIINKNTQNSQELNIDGVPIILTGAPIFIGDPMAEFIEDCGGYIVKDLSWLGDSFYRNYDNGKELNSPSKVFMQIAKRLQNNKTSLHISTQQSPLYNYIKYIKENVEKYHAKAIINHIIKFCDIIGHHRQALKDLLNEEGYTILNLERDYSRSMQGQLRTRIEAFMEMFVE